MSFEEILPSIQSLPRDDKQRLMEWLASDLQEEALLRLITPGKEYPVWSPFDAYEAAQTLQKMLAEHHRTKNG